MRNLLSSKVIDVQFTNISDGRIVDSISESLPKLFAVRSARVSSSWCNPNGCLRIVGKLIFSLDCLWTCQRRKLNTLQESNPMKTPININFNSTLNTLYQIELDAFTISKQSSRYISSIFVLFSFLQSFRQVSKKKTCSLSFTVCIIRANRG
jgi:hypothetical protein